VSLNGERAAIAEEESMKSRFAPVVAFLFFTLLQDGATAAPPAPTPDQQRIRVLVELLASKNTVSETSRHTWPDGYDRNAQVVVYLAIQQLLAEGATGFDMLLEHFNDKRYCYTEAYPDDDCNITVGSACSSIMVRCIKCYNYQIHVITNEQFGLEPDFRKQDLATWWKHNRYRPLWKIQVEAIDQAIALMERVRRDETRRPFRFSAELTPTVFESRRKENLRILKGLRASIVANEEAYRPKSLTKWLYDPHDAMLGLPWPTNPHRW
jgi:hypothetical protein